MSQSAVTWTGKIPVGFRRLASEWQGGLGGAIRFAKENRFDHLDVGALSAIDLTSISAAGLGVGACDLVGKWSDFASPDRSRRDAAVAANVEHIRSAVATSVNTFFAVAAVEDHSAPRAENFGYAADGFGRLARTVAPWGARIALEGWPGPAPFYSTLACTPADCRALFAAVDSPGLGINFDPSHLVRMGIDPIRFAAEFAARIFHVHAKDTELLEEERYEHGTLQPATFLPPRRWGGPGWRYRIPGRGAVPWAGLLKQLEAAGYQGRISIELEDDAFNGSEAGERQGLLSGRDFLEAFA